ncbi:MAG: DUF6596 domain-containing protein, partial [Bacteroidota bacterium]
MESIPYKVVQQNDESFRHLYAVALSILLKRVGVQHYDLIEDAIQDAWIDLQSKSSDNRPYNVEGWIIDVAWKKILNTLKRDKIWKGKIAQAFNEHLVNSSSGYEDELDNLKMLFLCCHPGLGAETQVTLALKSLCDFSIPQIGKALLVSESVVNKRLYRAKQKFRNNLIQLELPQDRQLNERLQSVTSTIYLLYNEGYYSQVHKGTIRVDLCFEAVRLVKQLLKYIPGSSDAYALLSLMLFGLARMESRRNDLLELNLLTDQHRDLWDRELIAEALFFLGKATDTKRVTKYHLLAGIAAEHCLAADFSSTNWHSIKKQYDILIELDNSSIALLNRSIAYFYAGNRMEALADMELLKHKESLSSNPHYYATIAFFHTEFGNKKKAVECYKTAFSLTHSNTEKSVISKRMKEIYS